MKYFIGLFLSVGILCACGTSKNSAVQKSDLIQENGNKQDNKMDLIGEWTLSAIQEKEIKKTIPLPTLTFNLEDLQISGNGGCNQYHAAITELGVEKLAFGDAISTRMACMNGNIEKEYFPLLSTITKYKVKNNVLHLFDESGAIILTYTKDSAKRKDESKLSNSWRVIQINGEEITVSENFPTISFDPKEMRINGNDGCNIIFGEIVMLTEDKIQFDNLGATKKMCLDMSIPDEFTQTIGEVASYKFKAENLVLFDSKGKELLTLVVLNETDK